MFDQLHTKLEGLEGGGGGGVGGGGWGVVGGGGGGGGGGKFHTLGQGLREEVERLSKQSHRWESYNVDQLVSGRYFRYNVYVYGVSRPSSSYMYNVYTVYM